MVIASSEWDPVWRRQECWSIVSNAPSEGEIRLARVSMGACRVTRAEKGLGTWAIDLDTKAAKPPSGGLRGLKRVDVASFPCTRSTRNVRQSLRFRSQATRYQR